MNKKVLFISNVKNFILFVIIVFFSILEMYAQKSPEFTFNKEFITIKKDAKTSGNLYVYRGEIPKEELSNVNPILGKLIQEKTVLRFIPLIPFGWNQKYTLVYRDAIEYFELDTPEEYKHLSVKSIYPSAKILPSNLLKWYIQFSHPISETYVYDHIRFINATGDTISNATLSLENALISDNGKLLTVWIEPGRQKRDLIPNTLLGPVFENGKTYKLVVLKKLKDANGISMQQDFIHSFRVTIADRVKPDIKSWKIQFPKVNSKSRLLISCYESLDYGSTLNSVTIINAKEEKIDGNWQYTDHESTLSFTPLHPWKKGNYKILFDTHIEDLAGNNLDRLFDSEIGLSDMKQLPIEYKLEFNVK
ncbi:Ig-like domain-containing protein [Aquimarina macrocephali]|uniref:Ig-like domain-containing protein n=1 Tax=Aquimarina macrocephali TaxID=666563 RepID=UPI0012695DE3|nr:Ig-like domain-containing protein [Aquimarina macrocephali]